MAARHEHHAAMKDYSLTRSPRRRETHGSDEFTRTQRWSIGVSLPDERAAARAHVVATLQDVARQYARPAGSQARGRSFRALDPTGTGVRHVMAANASGTGSATAGDADHGHDHGSWLLAARQPGEPDRHPGRD